MNKGGPNRSIRGAAARRAVSITSGSSSDSMDESALKMAFLQTAQAGSELANRKMSAGTAPIARHPQPTARPLLISDVASSYDRSVAPSPVINSDSETSDTSRQGDDILSESDPSSALTVNRGRHAARLRAVAIENSLTEQDKSHFIDLAGGVENVIRELGSGTYLVQLLDGTERKISRSALQILPNGPSSLHSWYNKVSQLTSSDEDINMSNGRHKEKPRPRPERLQNSAQRRRNETEQVLQRRSRRLPRNYSSSDDLGLSTSNDSEAVHNLTDNEDDDLAYGGPVTRRTRPSRNIQKTTATRRSNSRRYLEESEDELDSDRSPPSKRKRGMKSSWTAVQKLIKPPAIGSRRSQRSTRHQETMGEIGEDELFGQQEDPAKQIAIKAIGAREAFVSLPRADLFRSMHQQFCDACGEGSSLNSLVYCQGCDLAYHKDCIGPRNSREHLVTKVGANSFVLQCRRCVNSTRSREPRAPDLSICQICRTTGEGCTPFRAKKTPLQEQKEREDNDGEDPITKLPHGLVNNAANVLFRCGSCWRAFHFHHLPPKKPTFFETDVGNLLASRRFQDYSCDWRCIDCSNMPAKVSGIIAWRPLDIDSYAPGTTFDQVDEDAKEYLIRWENMSHFKAEWRPGAWTWGLTVSATRKAFAKRQNGPKMRTEDAIPEDFFRIDIILAVKYRGGNEPSELEDSIQDVGEALIKYKGLGYEESVWDNVPRPEDGERWVDFELAYRDWLLGCFVKSDAPQLQADLRKVRDQNFIDLEMKQQPKLLNGGELMDYQLQGLNWIYYQWHRGQNAILADEMGLGKTIQVIGFMATLLQEHNCFPFLVVVPNSTCANWRREIKQWAPDMRVVTFFGSSRARELALTYEMFPDGSKDLRCHVVVTSYETAADENCRKVFKSIPWTGLIVDEGQRLKSDKSILYKSLLSLKIPFRLLLTGTPLQNNARELFNLLQFLNESLKAEKLEEQYSEINPETIKQLHDVIRPFILRRTKAEVLTFLPSMAQIIVPLSMSVLQKKLYKVILSKSPDLLKAIFAKGHEDKLKPQERAGLSNILMQLRKCLCHPFVYSQDIEERTEIAGVSHRNLVEASAKLQLLEILLPKLRARGHRVLIFSQFLDMLTIMEDFLDGLQLPYQRLDGTMGSLEKQKRIDEFNAADSPLFAFLLSTRAGGVGINLATADTVIILDPDFNPHQDIQAISRAHRIGQKKKVLCFQLMTRSSAEEKVFQIGRKKMALDHVVVQNLDKEDDLEDGEVEAMLRHGAAELFSEDAAESQIKYDPASINRLLDRSNIENTKAPDGSVESQFSFARVWANDTGTLQSDISESIEAPPDTSVWDRILQERERAAQIERQAREAGLGRGKRARGMVDYGKTEGMTADDIEPDINTANPWRKNKNPDESDTDFMASAESEEEDVGAIERAEINALRSPGPKDFVHAAKSNKAVKPFQRAVDVQAQPNPQPPAPYGTLARPCPACSFAHPRGECPLKLAGAEHCNLCGLAHFGVARTCPHFNSETQVRAMLEALKMSSERKDLVDAAVKYLRGVKGHIVQRKKKERGEFVGGGPPRNRNRVVDPASLHIQPTNQPTIPPGIGANEMVTGMSITGGTPSVGGPTMGGRVPVRSGESRTEAHGPQTLQRGNSRVEERLVAALPSGGNPSER